MMRILRVFALTLTMTLAVASVACLTSAGARADEPSADARKAAPPRISWQKMKYYRDHPAEYQDLLARLPKPIPRVTGPVVNPPRAAPTVGGTWTAVSSAFPGNGASSPHLMYDGSVIVQDYCTSNWYKLTPDNAGSYANGGWSKIASMPDGYAPLYFASQVLLNGKFIVNGGEYNFCNDAFTTLGAIYDPVANTWASVTPPTDWTSIGDAQSEVLFNGAYMLADCCSTHQALLNLNTMSWTSTGAKKFDENDEEGWSLLQNGEVFTADAYVSTGKCGKNTEIYNPATGAWASAGSLSEQMSDCSGASPTYEEGPQVLRPNGTMILFSGVTTGAAVYTNYYNANTKKFAAGPTVPEVGGVVYTLADAPAAFMPNGVILYAASPTPAFSTPTHFFEYNWNNTTEQISQDTPNSPYISNYQVNLLVLPNGQILETDQSNQVELYNPVGASPAAWRPTIEAVAKTLKRGTTYGLKGEQLNGLTEAGAYGDDSQQATNFPVFRLINRATDHVFYCRTVLGSSRSIAASAVTLDEFVCPANAETGASYFQAVANGVASPPLPVTVQ